MDRDEIRFGAAGFLGSWTLRSVGATLRITVEDKGPVEALHARGQPVIYTFWHSRILPLAYYHRNEGIVVLVSRHGDGEYVTRVIERMGFATARGSSTRGGAAGLKGIVRAARKGHNLAFTPDGPKGPPRVLKPGVLVAAQLTGAAIVPLTAGSPDVWRVGSWDRMIVPKPFSRLTVKYGVPRFVERDADEDSLAQHAAVVSSEIDRITDAVDCA